MSQRNAMHLIVLPGDGIGPEITAATVSVLDAVSERFGLGLRLEHDVAGHESLGRYGTTVRPELLERVRAADGLVLGPMSTFDYTDESKGGINPSMFFRKNLDLFANIRPARTHPGVTHHAVSRNSTSWWCARTPRASTPTATWNRAAARCWRRRTSRLAPPHHPPLLRAHRARGLPPGHDAAQAA